MITQVILGRANTDRQNGVNQVVRHYEKYLNERDIQNEIVGLVTEKRENLTFKRSLKGLFLCYFYLRRSEILIFHGAFIPAFAVLVFLTSFRTRIWYMPHGSFHSEALRKKNSLKKLYFEVVEKMILRRSEKVLALNESESLVCGRHARRVVNVNNAMISAPYERIRQVDSVLRLGYLGRLAVYHKGLDSLLSFCQYLLSRDVKFILQIAGSGCEEDEEELKRVVEESGAMSRCVKFVGPLYGEDKQSFLDTLDWLMAPSRHEGMPIAVLEGLSRGLPICVSKKIGFDKLLDQYNIGVFFHDDYELTLDSMMAFRYDYSNYISVYRNELNLNVIGERVFKD